jgi:formate dehydrogenase iron-sulfur subunit
LTPACAKACPTESIRFGLVSDLRQAGRERVAALRAQGETDVHFYGDEELGGTGGIGGLNAMFILNAAPDAFNLPAKPRLPRANIRPATLAGLATSACFMIATALTFRARP